MAVQRVTARIVHSFNSASDATSYNIGTPPLITYVKGRLYLLVVTTGRAGANSNVAAATGWTSVTSIILSGTNARLNVLRMQLGANTTPGAITVTLGGATHSNITAHIVEIAGVPNDSANNGAGAIGTAQTATNGASNSIGAGTVPSPAGRSGIFAAFANNGGASITADSGWSQLANIQAGGENNRGASAYSGLQTDTTATATTSGSPAVAGISFELKASDGPRMELLDEVDTGADVSSLQTASVSPSNNNLLLVHVLELASAGQPPIPVVTGCGMTWDLVATTTDEVSSPFTQYFRRSVFRSMGTPSTGVVSAAFGVTVDVLALVAISQWAEVAQGDNGANAVRQVMAGDDDPFSSVLTESAFVASGTDTSFYQFIDDGTVIYEHWSPDVGLGGLTTGPIGAGRIALEIMASASIEAVFTGASSFSVDSVVSRAAQASLVGAARFFAQGNLEGEEPLAPDVRPYGEIPQLRVEVAWDNDPRDRPDASEWDLLTGGEWDWETKGSGYVRFLRSDNGKGHEQDDFTAGRLDAIVDNRLRHFDPLYPGPFGRTGLGQFGTSGGLASTPDHASLDLTADQTLSVAAVLDDWTPGVEVFLMGKWNTGSNQRSIYLALTADGFLKLYWSNDGTAVLSATSTAKVTRSNGKPQLLQAFIDVVSGGNKAVTFRTKALGSGRVAAQLQSTSGWTTLGSVVTTAGNTSVFSSSAALTVGADASTGSTGYAGLKVLAAALADASGVLVATPDFSRGHNGDPKSPTSSFADSTGKTWTLAAGTQIVLDRTNIRRHRRIRVCAKHFDLRRRAMSFDGTTLNYAIKASITNFPATEMTLEFRVDGKGAAASGDNSNECFFSYFSTTDRVVVRNMRNLTVGINNVTPVATGENLWDGLDHRVAITWRSFDGLLRTFVDGRLVHETTMATSASLPSGGTLVIGQEQDSLGGGFTAAKAFKGSITDIRLWNVARTHHNIHALTYADLTGTEEGLVGWWPCDEGAGISAFDRVGTNHLGLFGDWTYIEGDHPISTTFTETITPDYSDRSSTDSSSRIIGKDWLGIIADYQGVATSPLREAIKALTPYLYWPMDEVTGVAKDLSVNKRTGTYVEAQQGVEALFPIGDAGLAIRLKEGSRVEAAAGVATFERTESFTVLIKFRSVGPPTEPYRIMGTCDDATDPEAGWVLYGEGNEQISMRMSDGTAVITASGHRQVTDQQEHLVVVTYSGTSAANGFSVYIDGEVAERSTSGGPLTTSAVGTGKFSVGDALEGTVKGVIEASHCAIWNRVLTSAEIRALYDACYQPWFSDRTHVRFGRLLDILGIAAADRNIRKGAHTMGPIFDRLENFLGELQMIADVEVGGVYTDVNGRIVFDDRFASSFDNPLLYDFGDDRDVEDVGYTDLEAQTDDIDLANEVITRRTPDGPTIRKALDPDETDLDSPATVTIEVPWSDDEQADGLNDYVLARASRSTTRFPLVRFLSGTRNWRAIFYPRIHRDRLRTTKRPPGGGTPIVITCWLEQVRHTWTPRGGWETDMGVAADDGSVDDLFLLNRTLLNGSGVVG